MPMLSLISPAPRHDSPHLTHLVLHNRVLFLFLFGVWFKQIKSFNVFAVALDFFIYL